MSRRVSILLIVCLLLGGLNTVQRVSAQIAAWEVIVLAEPPAGSGGSYALVRVTAAGLDAPTPLPAGMIPDGAHLNKVIVSPGLRYVVVTAQSPDYMSALPVRIADLKMGTWIEFVPSTGSPSAYDISGFDPSGTRFALSYVYEDMSAAFPYVGSFGVVDAATGVYVEESARPEFISSVTNGGIVGWYVLGDWEADGIRLHSNCYACEPAFEGDYSAWNPDTAAFLPATGDIFSIFAEQLAATGEIITRTYSESYPFSTEPVAYFLPANVIAYLPGAAYLPSQTDPVGNPATPVIFNDPNTVDISGAQIEWVNDGNDVLVQGDGMWILLSRSGSSRTINLEDDPPVQIVGTPDGFIALAAFSDGTIHVNRYTLTAADGFQLGTVSQFNAVGYHLVDATPLGSSVDALPASFTPVLPDFAQLEAVMLANQPVCEGFMQSRIWQGQTARVTPGTANNIRINPTTGAEAVGQIPGGAEFRVLGGPICANGTAWWYLEYNGQYGYTAEGIGDTYFVELVRP